jgi:ATP/maltotriose-dependent transcriptional regulator MalT
MAERHAVQLVAAERWLELAGCLDLLPCDAEAESPWLLVCRAWTLWQRHDFGRMPALLERAETLAPRLGATPDAVPEAAVRAAINALWAALHLFVGAPEQALDRATRAREEVVDAVDPLYGWAIFLEGIALQFVGQNERALAVLTSALAEGTRQRQSLVIVRALLGLTFVHYLSGRLSDMEATARRLLELNEAAGQAIGTEWAHYLLGMVYYEWNQHGQARDHFGWGLAEQDLANHLVQRESILATAMLDHIEGRAAAAEALLATRQPGRTRTQHQGL